MQNQPERSEHRFFVFVPHKKGSPQVILVTQQTKKTPAIAGGFAFMSMGSLLSNANRCKTNLSEANISFLSLYSQIKDHRR